MTTTNGAFTIIIDNNNRILLIKRKDYPLWDLPGGRLKPPESLMECAKREAYEETGYHISITYKVGTYFHPRYNDIQHIYFGRIINGIPLYSTEETKNQRWFLIDHLPFNMVPNRRRQIKDYKCGYKNLSTPLKDLNLLLFLEKIIIHHR